MNSIKTPQLFQDDSQMLYTTMVGVMMAAIFAAGFHDDVDRTLTRLAPEGTSYPFPEETRLPAAKLTSAIGGFLLGVFFWTLLNKLRWEIIRQLLKYRDWLYFPRSFKTKCWFMALSAFIPREKFLYTFQHVLPHYPLPTLESTCRKMLLTVEPLVTPDEFQEIKKEMKEFLKNEGPMLQAILEKREKTEDNWVADLWDKYAYLVNRSSLLYTNFCTDSAIEKSDLAECAPKKQSARAGCVVFHHLKFYEMIADRKLPPLLVQNLVPICCHRYRYLFACTRVPGLAMDELKTYENSKHIIVIRKGIMYKVNVYGSDSNGNESILSPRELQTVFQDIIDETEDITEVQWNPAVFTTQNRTLWAQEREKLMSHPSNKINLYDVESAILHIALDQSKPKNLTNEAWTNLCGGEFNRWYDKSLTCTVYENGLAGGNVEHTTADATLTSRVLEYVWANSKYDSEGNAFDQNAVSHPILTVPTKIKWDLEEFKLVIPKYLTHHTQMSHNLDMHALKLMQGKGEIKKCRVSPDSFMQLALQLTFYRMHKKAPKTYETAMTRFFKYGRTETIRTVSMHSLAFTKAMDDTSVSKSDCLKHLKAAMLHHNNYKLDAMNGRASDRHMFGLYVAAKFAGISPKIFNIKVFTDYDQLSTSQSPYLFDKHYADIIGLFPSGGGFAPQTEDGYGVYYLFLGENRMTIHITSYHSCAETSSQKFGQNLLQAMDDMKILLKK
uniref:carnitine O-palmitoyltransferase 1, liver isoform-like n=1 Tax=Ciona intestinalis TaxID=7719 RepID=UPI000180BBCC|nr:carnitine O-palmitoyltransferase 1, liver isoform-like [Ciona intestinalis]|eukprot:XP_002122295.1 carnitine O-palmitoyltransferase 1, liver isoform-like [Ciona intestinalis]